MPKLVFTDTDGIERTVELGDEPVLIGRASECRVQSQDAMLSRRHARIIWDGGYFIEDLGSANGVFLDGERIERAPLRPGDEVRCGSLVMRVVPEVARVSSPLAAVDAPTPEPRRRLTPESASPELLEERSRRIQAEAAVLTAEQRASAAEARLAEAQGRLDELEGRAAEATREAERLRRLVGSTGAKGAGSRSAERPFDDLTNPDGAGAMRERAMLQRKIEQLTAEVRRLRGGGAPDGTLRVETIEDERVAELEARIAEAERERDEARRQAEEARRPPEPATGRRPAADGGEEPDLLRRTIEQLSAENRRLRQGMSGERPAAGGDGLLDAVSTIDDALADLRAHLRAGNDELGALAAMQQTAAPESLAVLREALAGAVEQLETARRRLRDLQRLLHPT